MMAGVRSRHRVAATLFLGLLVREIFSFWTGHPSDFELWVRLGYALNHGGDPYAVLPPVPGLSFANVFSALNAATVAYLPFWPLVTGLMYVIYSFVGFGNRFAYYFLLKQPIIFGDLALAYLLYSYASAKNSPQGYLGAVDLAVVAFHDNYFRNLGDVRLACYVFHRYFSYDDRLREKRSLGRLGYLCQIPDSHLRNSIDVRERTKLVACFDGSFITRFRLDSNDRCNGLVYFNRHGNTCIYNRQRRSAGYNVCVAGVSIPILSGNLSTNISDRLQDIGFDLDPCHYCIYNSSISQTRV